MGKFDRPIAREHKKHELEESKIIIRNYGGNGRMSEPIRSIADGVPYRATRRLAVAAATAAALPFPRLLKIENILS